MARGLVVPTTFTAADKVSPATRNMSRGVDRFVMKAEAGLARANRAFRRLMSPVMRLKRAVGSLGLFLGGAILIGAIGTTIGVMMDFEQANRNLASVMNTSSENAALLATDAKRLGATTAKTAAEVVGLQEAYARLGFETPDILAMTQSTISGSIAMRGELSQTAELVGAMVRTFDDFSAVDAPRIIDKLTVSTQKSALNFEKLQTSLPIVAGAANAAGIPFEQLLALLGKLSDAGIDASSSATSLRNIFLESAKKGHSYSQILESIKKNQDKLTTANDAFGKRAAVSATVLSNAIDQTAQLEGMLKRTEQGMEYFDAANIAAATNLDSLTGDLTILRSAYEGFILSIEDGKGPYNNLLRTTIQVATEILSLASGTAKANNELTQKEKTIRGYAEIMTVVLKTVGWVTGAMIAYKAALIVTKGILTAYNIVTGFTAGLQGKLTKSIAKNTAALNSYRVALALSHPVGLLSIALVGLGAAFMAVNKEATKQMVAQKIQTDLQNAVIEKTARQRIEVEKLFRVLKNTANGSQEYNVALQKLEAIQPGIIQKFQLEYGAIKDLNRAQKELISTIEERARKEAASELYVQSVKDRMLLEQQAKEKKGQGNFSQFIQGFYDYDNTLDQLTNRLNSAKMRESQLLNTVADDERSSRTPQVIDLESTTRNFDVQRSESLEKQQLDININDPGGNAQVAPVKSGAGFGVNLSSTNGGF